MAHPFSGSVHAVMAINTSLAAYRAVIELHLPSRCFVTNIAFTRGLNMIRALAFRNVTVMATGTNTDHLRMVDKYIR